MIWTKVSDYCIKSGDWTIAKYNVAGGVKYGLYRLNDLKGFYSTADEAKAQAK
ncbi:hypothetical protein UFOVP774_37 [uncultured Caudovirales phage]|uniref:Uncharacterized protein n=1 Tax=uncultured Caudovirales phage TaxID=2100421 RepID=A0A6J5NVP5_9CAUD|nr:hypothetical protein UFOVP774_37 [uncultured Caudovirales phage]